MSQEKIDAYKKEKAGRKERLAKQKVRRKVTKSLLLRLYAQSELASTLVTLHPKPLMKELPILR